MSDGRRDLPAPFRYRALAFSARGIVRVVFRPRVVGLEHVPHGGFVLSSNHLSGWDLVALGYPLSRRWLRHMAKPQLFAHPLLGPIVRTLGAFPAESGAVERAAELAREGYPVVIMPEGARRRPGDSYRPHTGAARVALAAGVPLIPAAVRGTDQAGSFARWSIAFARPVPLDDLARRKPYEAARQATDRLWSTIQGLEAMLEEADQIGLPASSRSSAR